MSKNLSSRNPSPKKKKTGISSLLAVLLSGMVLGLIVAGAVAWFLMKSPSPFVTKDQPKDAASAESKEAKAAKPEAKKAPESGKTVLPPEQAPSSAQAASAPAGDDKPRFEFYKVLTDKQEATVPVKKGATESKPAEAAALEKQEYYLQVGSYTAMDEAEKKKASLAMQGVEARIQTVDLPEKGVRHRVRLGPYKNMEEMNKMRASLKQNGVESTPMRGQ